MKKYSKELQDLAKYAQTKKISNIIRYNIKLIELLIKETNFLDNNIKPIERLWYIRNNLFKLKLCDTCNILPAHWDWRNKTYKKYCKKCIKSAPETLKKRYNTNLERYGYENPYQNKQKIKQICLKKHGNENYNNSKKIKQTWKNKSTTDIQKHTILIKKGKLKKYGNENYNNIKQIKNTNLEKHGGLLHSSKKISNQIKKTNLKKYGDKSYTKTFDYFKKRTKSQLSDDDLLKCFKLINNDKWIIDQFKSKSLMTIANELNISYKPIANKLIKLKLFTPKKYKSLIEQEFTEYVKILNNNVISNSRSIIKPLELDIYVPDYNLAIEINGLFHHSELFGKNKNYHLNKTIKCNNKGIQLLHIFENELYDDQKSNIWKSIIKNKLNKSQKIFARKCEIKEISPKDSKIFLNENHLQGSIGSNIKLGLYYNNELVSLMTFGKSRFNKKVDWELLRFCNKLNYYVIGGASKLFKHFLKEHTGSIISYADMRYSTGKLYKNLGFEFSHISSPNYWYFKNNTFKLKSRIKYQKHKLKNKLDIFNSNLSEWQNMKLNGYNRIFDCGNQTWIYKNNDYETNIK